jgi:hypothetical protein
VPLSVLPDLRGGGPGKGLRGSDHLLATLSPLPAGDQGETRGTTETMGSGIGGTLSDHGTKSVLPTTSEGPAAGVPNATTPLLGDAPQPPMDTQRPSVEDMLLTHDMT